MDQRAVAGEVHEPDPGGAGGQLASSGQRHGPVTATACSNATLSGSYGVLLSGFSLTGPDGTQLASPLPRGAANVITADGAGNLSRIGTGNVGGTVGPQPGTGTYTVNADCTFAVTITSPALAHVAGVLVNGGAGAFAVNSDPGAFIAMTWERQ